MTSTPTALQQVVITAEKLRRKLDAGRDVVVLEVSREPRGVEQDGAGHLPGAHQTSLSTHFAGPRSAGSGSFPLPTEDQLQSDVRRWGVTADSIVVVYSRENPALAARAWWTLRWAGVPDVRYLDGGADAWVAAGGDLSTQPPAEANGTFRVAVGSVPSVDTGAVGALAREGVLLDARGPDAYQGDGAGGGHIPGAVNLPGTANLAPDGRLKDDDELRELYRAAGVDGRTPVGAYCGGGVAAALDVLALARLGITAALYAGSFSAWSADPDRPVVTGGAPG